MMAEAGIIHMNGRIYDASIGRFLQVDPIIQDPALVGSLNRYSYTMNNPLNAVDPTGYSWISKAWKKLRPFIGVIIGAVVAIYCQVCVLMRH
jgi:RHS repeat-associated protein